MRLTQIYNDSGTYQLPSEQAAAYFKASEYPKSVELLDYHNRPIPTK